MKKKLKNNNFLIPSFLAGMTGLGFGEKVESNNAPSINISNEKLSRNKRNLSNKKNIKFSKNEEIYDIIKNNLKNEDEFKVDFGYSNGFHKVQLIILFRNLKKLMKKIPQKLKQQFLMLLLILKMDLLTRQNMNMLFKLEKIRKWESKI